MAKGWRKTSASATSVISSAPRFVVRAIMSKTEAVASCRAFSGRQVAAAIRRPRDQPMFGKMGCLGGDKEIGDAAFQHAEC